MVQQFLSAAFRLGQPPFSDLFWYFSELYSQWAPTSVFNMQGQAIKELCKCQTLLLCPLSFLFCWIYSVVQFLPSGLYWLVWNIGRFLENTVLWWQPALIGEWMLITLPSIRETRIAAFGRIHFFTPSALETWGRRSNHQKRDTVLWKMNTWEQVTSSPSSPCCRAAHQEAHLNRSQKVHTWEQ